MKKYIKRLFQTLIIVVICPWGNPVFSQSKETIIPNNEFGGQTVELLRDDFSIFSVFYDGDGNKVKEVTVFTNDYPIDNNLARRNVHYFFGKKTEEERIYSGSYSNRTMISRTIDYFDRNTGELLRQENHFIPPYSEYNVLYFEKGEKKRIEWHYPNTVEGIERNVSHLDDEERIVMTESFYSKKTARDKGYFKRIYYIDYTTSKFMSKSRQEWFYTEEYALNNAGVVRKVELFGNVSGKLAVSETIYYGQNNQMIKQVK